MAARKGNAKMDWHDSQFHPLLPLYTRAASFVLSPANVGRAEISFLKGNPFFQYSEQKRNPRDVDSVRFPLLFFFLFFSSFFHFGTTITNRIFWRVLDDDIPRQSMKMSRLRIIYTWTYVTCVCAFFFLYYSPCVFVLFSYYCRVPLIFVVVSLKWVTVSQWFMT